VKIWLAQIIERRPLSQRKKVVRRTASSPARQFRTKFEAAEILGVGINQLGEALARGVIRGVKFGRSWRISDDEIERLKRAESVGAADDIALALENEAARRNVKVGALIEQLLETAIASPTSGQRPRGTAA
jgi:excisionase family DNA binding protein